MKKLLIASSAVIGLGVVSADFAAAQIETTLSGQVRVRLAKSAKLAVDGTALLSDGKSVTTKDYATNGTEATLAGTDGANRARLNWSATGTTDTGLTYGAQLRLDDGARKKANIHFGGGFGTVTIGDIANPYGHGGAVAISSGGIDNAVSAFGNGGTLPNGMTQMTKLAPYIAGSDDDIKGLLYTGTFSGVSANFVLMATDGIKNSGGNKIGMALAVNYGGSFDNGSFNVGGSYAKAGLKSKTPTTGGVVTAQEKDDLKILTLGADVTFGPMTVGVTYMDAGNSGRLKDRSINRLAGGRKGLAIAAGYNYGAGSVGVSYRRDSEKKFTGTGTNTYKDKNSSLILGADYTIAPGWNVGGEVGRFKNKTGNTASTGNSAKSTVFALQSMVSF